MLLECYFAVHIEFYKPDYKGKVPVLLRRWSAWAVAPFQEIRMLNFEKTSGSDINVCFVFAITEKRKTYNF